jgi:DNA-directed RNA polymerase alpha subunit
MKILVEFTLEEFDDYQAYLEWKSERDYTPPELPYSVEGLELPTMFENILKKSGITTCETLCKMTKHELLKLTGMGKRGVKEIEDSLENFGFYLSKQVNA